MCTCPLRELCWVEVHSVSEYDKLINIIFTTVVDAHPPTEIVSVPARHTQKSSASCLLLSMSLSPRNRPQQPPNKTSTFFSSGFSRIVGITRMRDAVLGSHDCRCP
jgi:hypothetical protein